MKIENEVRIRFLSRSANESFARISVAGFFSCMDPSVDEISDLKTVVSEAVTNAIVHGYRGKTGYVTMTLKILENRIAQIRVHDDGCGIENIKQAMEPLYTSAPEEERAGLGFAVMQSFTDKVKVTSRPSKGTTIVMTKKLRPSDYNTNSSSKP